MHDHDTDALAAACIAFEAGQLLLSLRNDSAAEGKTASGATADVESNDLIARRLAEQFADDMVLSEEAVDTKERLAAQRVWIIDPLDGTREYNEPPRDDWAVHVALAIDGELRAGAVTMPALGMIFSTLSPFPARRPLGEAMRLAVSRTRPPEEAERVADRLGAVLVPMGSAGAKAMAVVRGEVDGYLHAGGQWEWDSAAPVAVATASGLHASRIDGSPFVWNKDHPFQPDLLICRAEIAEPILDALG